jgi:hypothetical protein
MHRWIFSLASLTLVLSSCDNSRSNETSSVIDSPILNRPIVAVVPIINTSRTDLTWDVSEELSQAVRQRLAQKDHLYLMGKDTVTSMAKKCFQAHDPFGVDTAWVKKSFPQNEFVVFMELMEHHEMPIYPAKDIQDSPTELAIAVRVRVFDVREQTPRVVLQEVVQQIHHIPRQFNKANFHQVPWTDEMFETSPLGIAHDALCKEIAGRIEDYILLSGN